MPDNGVLQQILWIHPWLKKKKKEDVGLPCRLLVKLNEFQGDKA